MGYSPWDCKEMDTSEATEFTHTDMEARYKWLPEAGSRGKGRNC